ncbi:MAG: anaerobic ribonucleoside-triphosphate reductase [Treponema sp.]|nr:anaerobic ribonucleoside-triphosphate reductase [Treponema sp.]
MAEVNQKRDLAAIDKEIAEVKEALANVHGTETEVYARIVGYYRAVRNWNKGKRDEYNHRKMFTVTTNAVKTPAEPQASFEEISPVPITNAQKADIVETQVPDSSITSYEFYARRTCPNCPPVKAYVASIAIPGSVIDVDTTEGLSKAALRGVFAAPTVIFYDANGAEIARGHNVEELTQILAPVTAFSQAV